MTYETLETHSRRFRLKDPTMTNEEVAENLLLVCGGGEHVGRPEIFFYKGGVVVGLRVTDTEIAILPTFEYQAHLAEQIAARAQNPIEA